MLVLDTSDPTNPSVLDEVDIPGTVQVLAVAVQGNRALVVGSTGGLDDPFDGGLTGNMTLSVLDISDPSNPQLIGTTLVTAGTFPTNCAGSDQDYRLYLGNGQDCR